MESFTIVSKIAQLLHYATLLLHTCSKVFFCTRQSVHHLELNFSKQVSNGCHLVVTDNGAQ